MSKARPLKGLAKAAKGQIGKGAKKIVPRAKNVRRARNLDIPTRPPKPKPQASNEKLQNIINNIWKHAGKKGTVGDGTTLDALRNEIITGRKSNGIDHMKKAVETMQGLSRLLRGTRNTPPLTGKDKETAEELLRLFGEAFGKGWG